VLGPLRGRRDFGIPESAFAFLFLFDLRSYSSRKNPEAAVEAFRRLVEARPASHAVLVLKVAGAQTNPKEMDRLRELLSPLGSRVVLMTREATDSETKNLIRCCDVFVSLHRSEGYGRGLAEAMAFGRPVIGTAYSGNLEFMTSKNSCLVGYDLVPVAQDAYPFWAGQVWADAHVDEAADWMVRLLDDEELARSIGNAGRRTVACRLSYAACGLRMRDRLATIAGTRSTGAANVG
jgi:glycosyltransferase involved in cell wall biosynthesis